MTRLNRRHFIAAAAAPFVAQGAGETVRTGLIGVGNRGSYHLKTVLEEPGVKVVALCDIKPDRLDKAATLAARDQPQTFTDYRRLLERKDVEAVFIATPCDLHSEMAIAALQAGKHVYCEKPLGINPDQVRALLHAGRNAKTVFQAGQQMRSDARLKQVIGRIHDGVAGNVIMVKAQRHAGDDLDHNGPSADWFFNAARSGDVIVEMAVHNLDVCNWIIGARPDRAAGFGGTLLWKNDPPGRTNMDGYSLTYDYANGVKMSFTQVFFHPPGLPGGGQYFYVYGTGGAVDVNGGIFYPRARGARPTPLTDLPAVQRGQRDAHIAAFFEAIRSGTRVVPADVNVGATAALTAILGRDAIYRKRVLQWSDMGVDV